MTINFSKKEKKVFHLYTLSGNGLFTKISFSKPRIFSIHGNLSYFSDITIDFFSRSSEFIFLFSLYSFVCFIFSLILIFSSQSSSKNIYSYTKNESKFIPFMRFFLLFLTFPYFLFDLYYNNVLTLISNFVQTSFPFFSAFLWLKINQSSFFKIGIFLLIFSIYSIVADFIAQQNNIYFYYFKPKLFKNKIKPLTNFFPLLTPILLLLFLILELRIKEKKTDICTDLVIIAALILSIINEYGKNYPQKAIEQKVSLSCFFVSFLGYILIEWFPQAESRKTSIDLNVKPNIEVLYEDSQ